MLSYNGFTRRATKAHFFEDFLLEKKNKKLKLKYCFCDSRFFDKNIPPNLGKERGEGRARPTVITGQITNAGLTPARRPFSGVLKC